MALRKANARIMRSGLRGSGAKLVTASAGPAAPLVEAKLVRAEADAGRMPSASSAAAARSAAPQPAQADGVNTARIMQDKGGNIVGGEFGFGNNVQRYDPKKIAWIMGRGASGGSLSRADQAVYDRMMYLRAQKTAQEQEELDYQKALRRKNAEDERKRKLDAAEWDRQHGIATQDRIDAENRQFELEEWRKENDLDRLYEELERTLSVKTPYEKELLDFKNLLGMERDAFGKQLDIASMPTKNQMDDLSPLGSQLQKAYEVAFSTLGVKARGDSIGLQRIYDGIIGGGATSEAPVEQQGAESTPDIASIYANGGSYFGNGETNDAPVAVRQPAGAVQTDPAIEDEESKRQYNWF